MPLIFSPVFSGLSEQTAVTDGDFVKYSIRSFDIVTDPELSSAIHTERKRQETKRTGRGLFLIYDFRNNIPFKKLFNNIRICYKIQYKKTNDHLFTDSGVSGERTAMGLIKAIVGAAGGVLADQWKEFFYCEALSADVLVAKGEKRTSRRSSNTKGEPNIITTGSVIAVNDGQCMIIVDQGKVAEICAEPLCFETILQRLLRRLPDSTDV